MPWVLQATQAPREPQHLAEAPCEFHDEHKSDMTTAQRRKFRIRRNAIQKSKMHSEELRKACPFLPLPQMNLLGESTDLKLADVLRSIAERLTSIETKIDSCYASGLRASAPAFLPAAMTGIGAEILARQCDAARFVQCWWKFKAVWRSKLRPIKLLSAQQTYSDTQVLEASKNPEGDDETASSPNTNACPADNVGSPSKEAPRDESNWSDDNKQSSADLSAGHYPSSLEMQNWRPSTQNIFTMDGALFQELAGEAVNRIRDFWLRKKRRCLVELGSVIRVNSEDVRLQGVVIALSPSSAHLGIPELCCVKVDHQMSDSHLPCCVWLTLNRFLRTIGDHGSKLPFELVGQSSDVPPMSFSNSMHVQDTFARHRSQALEDLMGQVCPAGSVADFRRVVRRRFSKVRKSLHVVACGLLVAAGLYDSQSFHNLFMATCQILETCLTEDDVDEDTFLRKLHLSRVP